MTLAKTRVTLRDLRCACACARPQRTRRTQRTREPMIWTRARTFTFYTCGGETTTGHERPRTWKEDTTGRQAKGANQTFRHFWRTHRNLTFGQLVGNLIGFLLASVGRFPASWRHVAALTYSSPREVLKRRRLERAERTWEAPGRRA